MKNTTVKITKPNEEYMFTSKKREADLKCQPLNHSYYLLHS